MSFYNLLNGVNPCTFFILPMLGSHPDSYPRFRDCFVKDEEHPEYDNMIHVYTRVGGGNRGCGFGEEEMMKHENFVTTFDDGFDSTYGTYVFSVPNKWKPDFDKILAGDLPKVSDEYKAELYRVYPKLKDQLDSIFNKEGGVE